MPEILKSLIQGNLSDIMKMTELDKNLLLLTAEFEDFCQQKYDPKTANEILGFVDRLTELFSELSTEKFSAGVKTGIALSKESQEFFDSNFKS